MEKKISIIIPTLNAAAVLDELIRRLGQQTVCVQEIIVIDSSSEDSTSEIARNAGATVEVIPREQFGHGKTRNKAADMANGDILVFMTQDALPVDEFFIENLTKPILDGSSACSYARQIAYDDAHLSEKFTREYNYPTQGEIRTQDDIDRLGIKAFFFSNVASSFDRDKFIGYGEFNEKLVMNEDMYLCGKMLLSDEKIAYAADARVYHSHNYSLFEQFKRYFSIGMFMAQAGEFLDSVPTGPAGRKFATSQLKYLYRNGHLLAVMRTQIELIMKWLGVFLGKHNKYLPKRVVERLRLY